jgi:hypothetical protein
MICVQLGALAQGANKRGIAADKTAVTASATASATAADETAALTAPVTASETASPTAAGETASEAASPPPGLSLPPPGLSRTLEQTFHSAVEILPLVRSGEILPLELLPQREVIIRSCR